MKKKLLFAFTALLVLLIAAALIALATINGIAKRAIETGGTYALGVPTTVSGISIGLFRGEAALSGLKISNPSGQGAFSSPHFLSLGHGSVAVSLRTLRQPTVDLPHLTLEKLDVNLEKRGGQSNFGTILDHLKQTTGGGDKPKAPSADERRYIIRELDLQNIVVHVDMVAGPGNLAELARVTVPIDRIRLTDVGKTGTGVAGTGVTMSELAGIVVKAILAAATDKGGGIIPAEVLGELKGKLAAFGDLDKLKMEVTADLKAKADDLTKKAIDEGKKQVDEAVDKLKDLIPGKAEKKK